MRSIWSSTMLSLLLSTVLSVITTAWADYASEPIPQPWSQKSYGPDGPWHAVNVNVGGQSLDLDIGGDYMSWFLSSSYCSNTTLLGTFVCPNPGIDTSLADDDEVSVRFYTPPSFMPAQSGNQSVVDVFPFSVQLPMYDAPTVENVSVALVDSAWLSLPNGKTYPYTLGLLSLGAPIFDQVFGSQNLTFISSSLLQDGSTPSASVGLHIGSVVLDIPPSMYYGGYDRSRVLGDVLSVATAPSRDTLPLFGVELLDVGIAIAQGGSPFDFVSKDGLLGRGNTSITSSILTQIAPQSPYLYLPRSTCDAVAAHLPVTYQEDYGLYFWNVNDPAYPRIVTSASFLSFTFRADNLPARNLTIKVPWSLLNLTLSQPIISPPAQYFPCTEPAHGWDGFYILGKAFLQAAFLAVDFKPGAPPGNWFLAQAPGPNTAAMPDVQVIADGATDIQASRVKWEDTWAGHWTVLPADDGQHSGSNATTSSGLSRGAQAGIGLGVVVAVLSGSGAWLTFWLKKRRRSGKSSEPPAYVQHDPATTAEKSSTVSKSSFDHGFHHSRAASHAPGAARYASDTNEHQFYKAPDKDDVYELHSTSRLSELPSPRR